MAPRSPDVGGKEPILGSGDGGPEEPALGFEEPSRAAVAGADSPNPDREPVPHASVESGSAHRLLS